MSLDIQDQHLKRQNPRVFVQSRLLKWCFCVDWLPRRTFGGFRFKQLRLEVILDAPPSPHSVPVHGSLQAASPPGKKSNFMRVLWRGTKGVAWFTLSFFKGVVHSKLKFKPFPSRCRWKESREIFQFHISVPELLAFNPFNIYRL